MRSIKPGRVPSWAGVIGGAFAAVFGVVWTIGASAMGAPGFFTAFGIVFVLMAVGGIFLNLHNATSSRRFSQYDITEPGEELDPLQHAPPVMKEPPRPFAEKARFCTKCGTALKPEFEFCPQCGQQIA